MHNISYALYVPPKERRCYNRRLPQCAIRKYTYSPLKYTCDSKNNQALLNTTGLDHKTFQEIVDLYAPYYLRYMCNKRYKEGKKKEFRQTWETIKLQA